MRTLSLRNIIRCFWSVLFLRFNHFDMYIYFDRSCPQTELLTADYRELPTCVNTNTLSLYPHITYL
nr:MAG TPA: hypothetical protein [Caudoviricetes sp.]DAW20575.1 MAG TPA: hypothetical protein [Caudoviricetes sp.]